MPPRAAGEVHCASLEDALHESARLLKQEFGDVDQGAAVELALFLFGARERVEFVRRDEESHAMSPDVT